MFGKIDVLKLYMVQPLKIQDKTLGYAGYIYIHVFIIKNLLIVALYFTMKSIIAKNV